MAPDDTVPVVDYLRLGGGEPYLVAQECQECGALYLDRRNACARCFDDRFAPRRLANTGTVRSFTIVHRSAPDVETPYISAVVDLDGGGTVKANLVDVPPQPDAVGAVSAVQLTTYPLRSDESGKVAVAFGFTPSDQEASQ